MTVVAADRWSLTIRSMEGRNLAISLAGGRIGIGVVSLMAPGFVVRTMTGRDASEGGTRLFAAWSAPATSAWGSGCSAP